MVDYDFQDHFLSELDPNWREIKGFTGGDKSLGKIRLAKTI
jgi:hypothetical protein